MAYERTDRKFDEYRNLKMTTGFISSADGSVLIEMGRTRVICNATLLPKVPDWLAGKAPAGLRLKTACSRRARASVWNANARARAAVRKKSSA